MRPLAISRLLVAACLVTASLGAVAAVIAQRDGPNNQGFIAQPSVVSFTTTDAFENVTIEAKIDSATGLGRSTIYLMTSVGPGTTAADEVASILLTGITFTPDITNVGFRTLFSGLDLPPDTYYLVLANEFIFETLRWVRSFTSSETVASGVTIGSDLAGAPSASYPPATAVAPTGFDWQLFRVTGDLVNRVPEPAPVMLLAMGFAMLAFRHRRLPPAPGRRVG